MPNQLPLWRESPQEKELFDIRINVKWDIIEIVRWGMETKSEPETIVESDTERFEFRYFYSTSVAGDYKQKAKEAAKIWLAEHYKGNFCGSVKNGEAWFVRPYGWGINGDCGKPFTTGKVQT